MELLRFAIVFLVVLVTTKSSSSKSGVATTITSPPFVSCSIKTGCECVDLGVTVNITCNNISNFDGLQVLADDSIFVSKKSYEITLKGIQIVPSNIIRNLNITMLILDDPSIEVISSYIFNGTEALSTFMIKKSSIQELPDFRYVNGSLEYLNVDNSKLTVIGLEVQNLFIVRELTFRNNLIRTVNGDAFQGLLNLELLDLSTNFLTSLPSSLLDGLTKLKSLVLSFNQLLSVQGLISVARPTSIYFDHNNLTNASEIFGNYTMQLEVIDLSHNPLTKIDDLTFTNHTGDVKVLSLDNCSLTEFDFKYVQELSSLRRINLSSNLIERVPEGIVDFGVDLEIYLDNNRISTFDTELTYTVQLLHLSENRMKRLGSTLRLTQIPDVEINRNQLEAILEEDLKGMHGTTDLSFSQNLISRIDSRAFASLRNDLENLDLSHNQLRVLNSSVCYLSRLQVLNVSHNNITSFLRGEFLGLNELKKLDLQYNNIVALQGQLQSIPRLQYLMVQFNNLSTVTVQQLPGSLTLFYYEGNPIRCNCQILPFLEWLKKSNSPETDSNYCESGNDERISNSQSNHTSTSQSNHMSSSQSNPTSSSQSNHTSSTQSNYTSSTQSHRSPNAQSNHTFNHHPGFRIFNIETCPQPCKCSCSQNTNGSFLLVDCSYQGVVDPFAPFIKEDGPSISTKGGTVRFSRYSMRMWENVDSRFVVSDHVQMISLENNRITSMDNWTFPRDLKYLKLAGNQLTRLPPPIMSMRFLRRVSLSGNPWICDCESLNFKKWVISKMSGIEDINETRCSPNNARYSLSGKLLASLSDLDLCPVALGLYIMITFVVLKTRRLFHCGKKMCNLKFPWMLLMPCLISFAVQPVSSLENYNQSTLDRCMTEIGCTCFDLDLLTGVTCHNFSDFELLTRKLADGSIFAPSPPETYEITLSGIRNVPPQVIKGLMVFHLVLDDPAIETISDEAFDGVQRLRRFRIRISSVRKIPDFQKITHSLRNLNIDNSLITDIGYEIQNLDLLTEISFRNNSIQSIVEDAFIGLPVLQTLDLSRNRLTVLPAGLLRDLPDLRMLALSHNQLLSVSGLLAIARPRFILLDHNNLTNADEILYENMTEVETVILDNNPLSKLSEDTFNTRIPNVRFLYLDNCFLKEFNVRHFWNLTELALLTLTSNLIEHVSKQVIGFGTSTQILLDDNQISSFEASITPVVRRFTISRNRLTQFGPMFQFTNITELYADGNRLTAITDANFKGMKKMENLNLRKNLISRIDVDTFSWLKNTLQNLDLSSNRLASLNGSIRLISTLKSLNVSHNDIESVRQGEFDGLNQLSELYMQYNKIIALPSNLVRIPDLQYLIVQHNRIYTVNPQVLPKSLKFFYYKDNPIMCNCNLLPFLQWLKEPDSPQTDSSYCQNNVSNIMDDKLMVNAYPGSEACPEPCRCTCNRSSNNNDTFIAIDCSSRNLREPPRFFQIGDNTLTGLAHPSGRLKNVRQNVDPRFEVSDPVLATNLEDNKIISLDDWVFPTDLRILRLANNDLTKMSFTVMALFALRQLSLSENPWACNCEARDFLRWFISKTEETIDVNDTRCALNGNNKFGGHLLTNLTERELCPVSLSFYIPVAFSALVLLLLVAAFAILYKQYGFKAWLYANGISCVKEKYDDEDKMFDAFVSFSQLDHELVNNKLVPGIERRLKNIRLCIHDRNFPAGEYIYNSIINAVRSSKITLLVLSKNFMESEWCKVEFQTAYTQAFEDKIHKIIAIKVGDLPEVKDPAIKTYLNKITYIAWDEKYFWQKMIYVLPTPDKRNSRELALVHNL